MSILHVNKKRINSLCLAFILSFSTIASVIVFDKNANAWGGYTNDETGVKNAVLMKAFIEDCAGTISLKRTAKIGESLDSIFEPNSTVVSVGQWLANENGGNNLTCNEVIKKLFSGVTIMEQDTSHNGVLEGVYDESSTMSSLICEYQIVNSDATAINNSYYSFPQGYTMTDKEDMMSLNTIPIYFGSNGIIDKKPYESDSINPGYIDFITEYVTQHVLTRNDGPDRTCSDIVTKTAIYNRGNFDGYIFIADDDVVEMIQSGEPARGLGVRRAANGVVKSSIRGRVESGAEGEGYLTRLDDEASARNNLIQHIRNKFNTGVGYEGFLSSNDAKYIVYGRTIFNGDGNYPHACQGVSVIANEENLKAIAESHHQWDDPAHVFDTRAFIPGQGRAKNAFKTKLGGGKDGAGTIGAGDSFELVNGMGGTCEGLISSFNGMSDVSDSAVSTVYAYINPYNLFSEIPDDNTVTPVRVGEIDEDACYQHAGSLGWIICPVINGMSKVVNAVYTAVEPLIAVSSYVIEQIGDDSGNIYHAWVQFRDVANILFVIFFVIVIFSQITGLGIDNYGIKKMLPKLILTGVLINLSFIITAIIVDASNVVGNGIQGFFESLTLLDGGERTTAMATFLQATAGLIDFIVPIGAGAAAIALGGGWALLIPILLYLLSAAISLFFAWIVLGLRQAIVILLIVFSPIAIVLMALPNTEKIYKKYIDLFKGVIVVYPVIGALMGAGAFTSKLLLMGNPGFIMTLVSGLLCVMPLLLIPSLTRRSLDALGSLGTTLQGFGNRLGGRASGAIGNAEAVKELRQNSADAAKARRATHWLNTARGRAAAEAVQNGTATRRQASMYKRHALAEMAERSEAVSARGTKAQRDRIMTTRGYDGALEGISKKEFDQSVSDQNALYERDGIYDDIDKFEREVYDAATKNDRVRLEALMSKATNGSDAQREHMSLAMDRALATRQVDRQTAAAYGSHISNNAKVYKDKDRSQFAQAQAILGATNSIQYNEMMKNRSSSLSKIMRSSHVSDGFTGEKMSAESIFGMDDGEFHAISNNIGSLETEQRDAIERDLQGALNKMAANHNGKYDYVKPETVTQIKEILGKIRSIDVPHDTPPAGPRWGDAEPPLDGDFSSY